MSARLLDYMEGYLKHEPEYFTGNTCGTCGAWKGDLEDEYEPCTDSEYPDDGHDFFDFYSMEYIEDSNDVDVLTGVEFLVAWGGPNVWVRCKVGKPIEIEGAWWLQHELIHSEHMSDEVVEHYQEYWDIHQQDIRERDKREGGSVL